MIQIVQIKKDNKMIKKYILLLIFLETLLFSDAVTVTNLAERATFRVLNLAKRGMGTGFLINNDGYVITNNHVTKGYKVGKLVLLNKYNRYMNVTMIKTYPKKDITILKIENYSDGKYLKLQKPNLIKKGHSSFSLGYPGGSDIVGNTESQLDSTVKSGEVSKILETSSLDGFPLGYKLIETSSDINGGNSGGPLLSKKGTVIGINTFKNNDTNTLVHGGSIIQGIFWAIHVEELIKVLDENSIKYTLSTDDIGEVSNSDIQSDFKLIFILVTFIIGVLIIIFLLIRRNSNSSVQSNEISQLVRDKMDKYGLKSDIEKKCIKPIIIDYTVDKIILKSQDNKYSIISVENNKNITIGRSTENTISVNNTFLSSQHLKIKFMNSILYVKDLDSTNGTYIDGKKLTPNRYYSLKQHQKLILGSEEVVYKRVN